MSTVRQYLKAGLIDSLHLASVPVLLGQGEPLFQGLDLHALGIFRNRSQGLGIRDPSHVGEGLGRSCERNLITREQRAR